MNLFQSFKPFQPFKPSRSRNRNVSRKERKGRKEEISYPNLALPSTLLRTCLARGKSFLRVLRVLRGEA
jgi:hypothetical protein